MSTPTIIETEYIDLDKETKKAKILDLTGKIIVGVFGVGGGIGLILLVGNK
jgi:RPA family protein